MFRARKKRGRASPAHHDALGRDLSSRYQAPFYDAFAPLLSPPAIHTQFRIFVPERLGDVATPADRLMGRKQLGKLLRLEGAPLSRLAIRPDEGRDMIEMLERSKAFAAVHTALSLIPVGNNVPY